MVLVDPNMRPPPAATRVFQADVLVLHHPTTIKEKYQAMVHVGNVRQQATVEHIDTVSEAPVDTAATGDGGADGSDVKGGKGSYLRTGDRAVVRFRFLQRPEYIHDGDVFLFREGNTKGLGRVTKAVFTAAELEAIEKEDALRKEKEKEERRRQAAAARNGTSATTTTTAVVASTLSAAATTPSTDHHGGGVAAAGTSAAADATGTSAGPALDHKSSTASTSGATSSRKAKKDNGSRKGKVAASGGAAPAAAAADHGGSATTNKAAPSKDRTGSERSPRKR